MKLKSSTIRKLKNLNGKPLGIIKQMTTNKDGTLNIILETEFTQEELNIMFSNIINAI